MIKEDNLSDTNELYLTLHKAGDLCSQSLFREMQNRMEDRTFFRINRIKNKE